MVLVIILERLRRTRQHLERPEVTVKLEPWCREVVTPSPPVP